MNARKTILIGAMLVAQLAVPALALDPTRPPDEYHVRAWPKVLPHNAVRILQTRDGYLWIGTNEGLVRFNGVDFQVFDERTRPALPSRRVNELYEDPQGVLWIGTNGGGLARYADGEMVLLTGV